MNSDLSVFQKSHIVGQPGELLLVGDWWDWGRLYKITREAQLKN